MPDVAISELGINNITKVYQQIKTNALLMAPIGVSSLIGMAIVVSRFFKEWRNNVKAGADFKIIEDLVWQYLFSLALIALAPFVIYAVETVFGEMQQMAMDALGGEPKGAYDNLIADTEAMIKRYPKGPSIFFDTVPDIFAYAYVIYLRPFLAVIVRWMYGVFLCSRFLYLLLLEFVYPIAFVCLFSEEHAKWFYSWVGHMCVCYLMIPAFLLANAFADGLVLLVFNDPYTFFGIMMQFVLKLSLLGAAKMWVFKLI